MHSLVATSQLQFSSGLTNAYEYIALHSHSFKLAQRSKLRTHREGWEGDGERLVWMFTFCIWMWLVSGQHIHPHTHTESLWISGKFDEISLSLSPPFLYLSFNLPILLTSEKERERECNPLSDTGVGNTRGECAGTQCECVRVSVTQSRRKIDTPRLYLAIFSWKPTLYLDLIDTHTQLIWPVESENRRGKERGKERESEIDRERERDLRMREQSKFLSRHVAHLMAVMRQSQTRDTNR